MLQKVWKTYEYLHQIIWNHYTATEKANTVYGSTNNIEFAFRSGAKIITMLRLSIITKEGVGMAERIMTPKISEILWEEFMEPMGISAYKLAKETHVPVSRVQDILHDRRGGTADTSLRLGKYFGVSETYFLNLQNDIDIRNAKMQIGSELESIVPLQSA